MCSQDFSDQILMVEPWNRTQAGTSRCLQALASLAAALEMNKSVRNMDLEGNEMGADIAKAIVCGCLR